MTHMRNWQCAIAMLLLLSCTGAGTPRSHFESWTLQQRVDALEVGVSDLRAIERFFGKAAERRQGLVWHQDGKRRVIYYAKYPDVGLSFTVLTNPIRLYEITMQTDEVAWQSLRVGDSLDRVRQIMGEDGEWRTTNRLEWWWLQFDAVGVRFGFARDTTAPRFPRTLAKPERVMRISRYDASILFLGEPRRIEVDPARKP